MNYRLGPRAARRGLATVELAVCLPVLMLIVFASIEGCSMIFLQETLQTTAYETARFAVAPRSTSQVALDRGDTVLNDRGVRGGQITLQPANMDATDRGTPVLVRVSAPLGLNRRMPKFFFGNRQLVAEVTMLKE